MGPQGGRPYVHPIPLCVSTHLNSTNQSHNLEQGCFLPQKSDVCRYGSLKTKYSISISTNFTCFFGFHPLIDLYILFCFTYMAQVISEVAEMLNQLASFPGGSGAMIFLTRVYGGYHKLVRWGYIPTYNVWEPLPAMRVFF